MVVRGVNPKPDSGTGPGETIVGEWRAINRASGVVGSIHDDEAARQYGFRGGFVGGITILARVCEAWRQHQCLPLTLRPFRMTMDLRSPVYQDDVARIRATQVGVQWRYSVETDTAGVTSDGVIEAMDVLPWPERSLQSAPSALDGVDLSGLPVRERAFSLEEVRHYYMDTLGTTVEDSRDLPVSIGLWGNPNVSPVSLLKAMRISAHRSSEIFVSSLPVTRKLYRFVDVLERLEPRTENSVMGHVRCDVLDPTGQRIAVILHRSSYRRLLKAE